MKGEIYPINLPVGIAIGTPQDVRDLSSMWLQLATVSGSPVGTLQIEGTIDGTHYFSVGAALTAAGILEIAPKKLTRIRVNATTAITAGVWALTLGAFNERSSE